MVTCGRCHRTYPRNERGICPYCGSNIIEIKEAMHVECSECGADNSTSAARCSSCGAALQ